MPSESPFEKDARVIFLWRSAVVAAAGPAVRWTGQPTLAAQAGLCAAWSRSLPSFRPRGRYGAAPRSEALTRDTWSAREPQLLLAQIVDVGYIQVRSVRTSGTHSLTVCVQTAGCLSIPTRGSPFFGGADLAP